MSESETKLTEIKLSNLNLNTDKEILTLTRVIICEYNLRLFQFNNNHENVLLFKLKCAETNKDNSV